MGSVDVQVPCYYTLTVKGDEAGQVITKGGGFCRSWICWLLDVFPFMLFCCNMRLLCRVISWQFVFRETSLFWKSWYISFLLWRLLSDSWCFIQPSPSGDMEEADSRWLPAADGRHLPTTNLKLFLHVALCYPTARKDFRSVGGRAWSPGRELNYRRWRGELIVTKWRNFCEE